MCGHTKTNKTIAVDSEKPMSLMRVVQRGPVHSRKGNKMSFHFGTKNYNLSCMLHFDQNTTWNDPLARQHMK